MWLGLLAVFDSQLTNRPPGLFAADGGATWKWRWVAPLQRQQVLVPGQQGASIRASRPILVWVKVVRAPGPVASTLSTLASHLISSRRVMPIRRAQASLSWNLQ